MLEVTQLHAVVHGPTSLRLGSPLHDRAGEGLLEYAHQLGAAHVVYHPLDLPKRGAESEREEFSLRLARWAEVLGIVICLENLCPVYPGEARVCHDPGAVHKLVLGCDSPAVRMVFDRLDLHLPPGIGTLPWESIAEMLSASPAPLVMDPPVAQAAGGRARRGPARGRAR